MSDLDDMAAGLAGDSVRGVRESVPESDEIKEAQLAQTVRELFYRARDGRRPLIGQWKKNYRVLNNKTWSPRAEPWMPAPEISNIWPIIASMVAWMTDQRPVTETTPIIPPFSPDADYYDKLAEHMNACLKATFQGNDLDAEIEKLLWDVCTYQIGYMKTTWEPWLADGYGDAAFRRCDPFTIYPDPLARSPKDLGYIIEAKIMTVDDLDRAFPGSTERVMAGHSEDIDESPHRMDQATSATQPRTNLAAISPSTYSRFAPSERGNKISVTEDPTVVVLEAWIRTHETVTHEDDDSIQEGTARVIDRWKCVVTCGNTVLMNEFADDIYSFTTHPYDRMVLFETGEWYGPGLVEFITSPQESINRMLANIEQNIMLVGNPIFYEGRRANSVTKSNRPGQRIKGASRDEVGWLEPPTLHPDQINLISYYESKIESISGLSAIVRGFSPEGRNSSDVLSSVQDSAFVRVRATLRNLERCLRGVTQKQASLISEFYTEPRMIATVGVDGTKTRLALKSRQFYTLAPTDGEEQDGTPMRFQIMADAGSEHPTSRGARQEQAERLFALGAIDEIEVLKAEKWPNWRQVATRVLEAKAAQGEMGKAPGKRQASRAQ
jgi:hypothetical protein